MIRTFADKRTHDLYRTGKSRRLPSEIVKRAVRKLDQIHAAVGIDDLKEPPSNRLHTLGRERAGQYSISINDQWRICFKFHDKDAYDVEICDYH